MQLCVFFLTSSQRFLEHPLASDSEEEPEPEVQTQPREQAQPKPEAPPVGESKHNSSSPALSFMEEIEIEMEVGD